MRGGGGGGGLTDRLAVAAEYEQVMTGTMGQ